MYKLTYSTMFDPPPEMHTRFEAALNEVRGRLGAKHALHIDGKDVLTATASRQAQSRSIAIGRSARSHRPARPMSSARCTAAQQLSALARHAARRAHRLVATRRGADRGARLHIAAALTLEVGKNRMEALGEVQETADFFNVYCDDFLQQQASIARCRTIRCRTRSRAIAA